MPAHEETDFRLGLLTPPPPQYSRQPEIDHTAPDPLYDTYHRILPMGAWPSASSSLKLILFFCV
jgi:hypothetical protein